MRGQVFLPKKAVYRHGSISNHSAFYEINTIDAIKTSSSKLLMKKAFDQGGVKHLPWILLRNASVKGDSVTDGKTTLKFPVVIKSFYGSRGKGNFKVNNAKEYEACIKGKTASNYLVETYFNGSVEFRVHITAYGPIYCLRKMLKTGIPEDKRWVRNDDTCVWITEYTQNKNAQGVFKSFSNVPNPVFDKPSNWAEIIQECKKALTATGGDLLAVDVKAQSNKDGKGNKRGKVDFYILEVNSAPSIGNITGIIYKQELGKILRNKYANFKSAE